MMQSKKELLHHMKERTMVFANPLIEEAFSAIDRADFVQADYRIEAYEDYPLPLGYDQTLSQPTTVAFMLEKLNPQKGDKILDVGSGSGFTTALLAHIVGEEGEVFGVELLSELVERGRKNLSKYNFPHAEIFPAEKKVGKSGMAPFDKILVSAEAEGESEMIDDLLDQLAYSGRMVIPIDEALVLFKKDEEGVVQKKSFDGFVFVPLIDTQKEN
jgi:protein-L-isoaspartate(D-aspartate) O-methyltransferase